MRTPSISLGLFAALLCACGGGPAPTGTDAGADGGASGPTILGGWAAEISPTFHHALTFSGGEAAGSYTLESVDATMVIGLDGCHAHLVFDGTFTRTGTATGAITFVATSATRALDSCTDPADDAAPVDLTPAERDMSPMSGTYDLATASLTIQYETSSGTFPVVYTRP